MVPFQVPTAVIAADGGQVLHQTLHIVERVDQHRHAVHDVGGVGLQLAVGGQLVQWHRRERLETRLHLWMLRQVPATTESSLA